MKKISFLLSAFILYVIGASGQCTPNTASLGNGNYIAPPSLPGIVQGTSYSGVLSILIPDSLPGRDFNNPEVAAFTVYIDSVSIQSITGYPTGITSASTPALGAWIPANGYACALFSGSTTAPIGNYPLTISGIGCGYVNFPLIGPYDTCMAFDFTSIYPYDLQVSNTPCTNAYDTTYATICRGDSVIWGSANAKRAGQYNDTALQGTGCDSLHILMLSVVNPAFGRDSISACLAVMLNGTTYTADTTVTLTYPGAAANGCDSSVRYSVYVGGTVVPTVAVSGGALQATDAAAVSYQWLENGTAISGATSASYTPTGATPNSYTVIATDAFGCTDTSAAYLASGIAEIGIQSIRLYPNPNNGSFILQTRGAQGLSYMISNSLGQVIEQKAISSDSQTINLSNVATGVYTLTVKGANPIPFTISR